MQRQITECHCLRIANEKDVCRVLTWQLTNVLVLSEANTGLLNILSECNSFRRFALLMFCFNCFIKISYLELC